MSSPFNNPNDKNNSPYAWHGGDTSTFSEQSKNLGEQVGNQGLNTGLIDVQKQTADAERKAGQSGQNVAAGAGKVAEGATVDVNAAQAPPALNPDGTSSATIEPYKVTKEAPTAPDTNVKADDISGSGTYNPEIDKYLSSLFNGNVPQSVTDAINGAFQANQNNPNDYSLGGSLNHLEAIPIPKSFDNNNLQNTYTDYLKQLKDQYGQIGSNPQDRAQFQNYLQNKLADQLQTLGQNYQTQQGNLATQNTQKQQEISDYIAKLNQGLTDYQKRTGDLSNVGQLSDAESQSAANNAILAGENPTGVEALSALSHGGIAKKNLAALSQQAQNAAIQQAEGKASAAQSGEEEAKGEEAAGQKAQANAYTKAGETINKNQETQLNKLTESNTAAQKALNDAYNSAKTNLNTQEQDYVNKAQDTLKNAKVPEQTIQDATSAFANSVNNYIDSGSLNDAQKQDLGKQLESIWRVAVGSNPSDIDFSDKIAGLLNPLYDKLGYKPTGNK